MKILLKVFFVGFLIFMGMQLYSCASRRAYERELIKQGNVAHQEGDFSLFKEIFEYYKDEPHVEGSFTLENADNRHNIENKTIKFDLVVFLQAEKGKNHLTVILTNLEMERPDYTLRTVLKKDGGDKVLEERLVRLSKHDWYIQYFEFDCNTIDELIITHTGITSIEPIVLYSSKENPAFSEHFLAKPEDDMVQAIKDNRLEENGIVKRAKDPFQGKGASVLIVLAIYTLFAGLLMYAVLFTKKGIRKPIKKEELSKDLKEEVKEENKKEEA